MDFKKKIIFIAFLFLVVFMGSIAKAESRNQAFSPSKPYTVLVVLEALPGKESQLKEALFFVKEQSLKEKTSIEYRLHQDLNNPAKFFLYETWTSKEDHLLQFQKPYIIDFGNALPELLAKPYEVVFAEQI